VAAAYSIKKPLVFGEFGMGPEGYNGASEIDWYRAYFEDAARNGAGGAMFWIITPDAQRGYGVVYSSQRDAQLLAEIRGASHLFASLVNASPPPELTDQGRHLIPHQLTFERSENDEAVQPKIIFQDDKPDDKSILYRFTPNAALRGRFEKLGGGQGYIWGAGAGSFEYVVPGRKDRRKVGEIIVRAHIQPVLPTDAKTAAYIERFAKGLHAGPDALEKLEQSVKEYLVSHLAGLANVEGVVGVAKKLGV